VLLLHVSVFIWVARLARSENHLSRRASERANRQCSCGSGETVPQFTFSLFQRFVNSISSVSTGFFRVLPVFVVQGAKIRLFPGIFCEFWFGAPDCFPDGLHGDSMRFPLGGRFESSLDRMKKHRDAGLCALSDFA
jgi:hypothetical protein